MTSSQRTRRKSLTVGVTACMDMAVRSKRQTLATVLLAVWVVGQFPWLMALVAGAHGPHEMSVALAGNRVAVVLGHSEAAPADQQEHDDHVLEFAAEQQIRTPSSKSVKVQPPIISGPFVAACLPVSELILAKLSLSPSPIPSSSLIQLRATVLVV